MLDSDQTFIQGSRHTDDAVHALAVSVNGETVYPHNHILHKGFPHHQQARYQVTTPIRYRCAQRPADNA